MPVIPKIGDKVYCVKDIYRGDSTKLIFIKNNLYTINTIKNTNSKFLINEIDVIISIISTNDNHQYSFWIKNNIKENLFDQCFIYIKKFRKEKLEKLYEH